MKNKSNIPKLLQLQNACKITQGPFFPLMVELFFFFFLSLSILKGRRPQAGEGQRDGERESQAGSARSVQRRCRARAHES